MVLEHETYRTAARNIQQAMQQFDPLDRAADIIEDTLNIRVIQQALTSLR